MKKYLSPLTFKKNDTSILSQLAQLLLDQINDFKIINSPNFAYEQANESLRKFIKIKKNIHDANLQLKLKTFLNCFYTCEFSAIILYELASSMNLKIKVFECSIFGSISQQDQINKLSYKGDSHKILLVKLNDLNLLIDPWIGKFYLPNYDQTNINLKDLYTEELIQLLINSKEKLLKQNTNKYLNDIEKHIKSYERSFTTFLNNVQHTKTIKINPIARRDDVEYVTNYFFQKRNYNQSINFSSLVIAIVALMIYQLYQANKSD